MNSGILLVAHGKPSYWDEAATLARSLRYRSPQLAIAIASDLNVPEKQWRRDGYDIHVPFDFRECGGVSFTMQLDRIAPFRDAALFIDSDSICYRDISGVFDAFAAQHFVALGITLTGCHWYEDNDMLPAIPVRLLTFLLRRLLSVSQIADLRGGVQHGKRDRGRLSHIRHQASRRLVQRRAGVFLGDVAPWRAHQCRSWQLDSPSRPRRHVGI
jgi:hypothetical protein